MTPQELLREGTLVELETQEALNMKTIVFSHPQDQVLSLYAPYYQGQVYMAKPGDKFVLYVISPKKKERRDVYRMDITLLEKTVIEDIQTFQVKLLTAPEKVQRREFFRLDHLQDYEVLYNNSTDTLTSKDISASGMRGFIPQRLPDGAEIIIRFPIGEESYDIKARVISATLQMGSFRKYDTRLHFVDLTSKLQAKIFQHLMKIQADSLRKVEGETSKRLEQYFLNSASNGIRPSVMQRIKVLNLLSLVFLFVSLMLLLEARPPFAFPVARFFGYTFAETWNTELLYYASFGAMLEIIAATLSYLLVIQEDKEARGYLSYFSIAFIAIGLLIIGFSLYHLI